MATSTVIWHARGLWRGGEDAQGHRVDIKNQRFELAVVGY